MRSLTYRCILDFSCEMILLSLVALSIFYYILSSNAAALFTTLRSCNGSIPIPILDSETVSPDDLGRALSSLWDVGTADEADSGGTAGYSPGVGSSETCAIARPWVAQNAESLLNLRPNHAGLYYRD